MSVVIKGIKIPPSCKYCWFEMNGFCCIKDFYVFDENGYFKERPYWCPISELPKKHDRLVDVYDVYSRISDTILNDAKENNNHVRATSYEVEQILNKVKTVIEAEG